MTNYDGDITLTVGLDPGNVKNTAQDLQKDLNDIVNINVGKNNLSKSAQSLLRSMDQASSKAFNLVNKMNELGAQKLPTSDYAYLSKEADKLSQKLTDITAKQERFLAVGGRTNSKTYKGLIYDYEQAEAELLRIQELQKEMRTDGTAFISGEDIQEYANLAAKLNDVNNQMVILRQRAIEGANAQNRHGESTGKLSSRLTELIGKILKTSWSLLKMNVSFPVKVAKKFLSVTKKLLVNLVKLAGNAIRNGISKLASAFGKLGKNSNAVNNGLKIGFKQLLRYGLGVRSVFFLVKRLRSALIEGFGNLSKYSQPLNETLSKFVSLLETLKNQFAAAFAPIVQIVFPILNGLLSLVNQLIIKFGELMYALTGHKVYIEAKEVQKDYADSLDKNNKKTKDNTKKTKENTKAVEEQKRQLMGFDDVEILHEDKDKDADKNTDTGTGTDFDVDDLLGEDLFKTLPIEDRIKDLADRIKQAWKNADFTDIGRMLGNKLLNALNNIPWDSIKAKLRQIAKSIATFLNGFLETPGLFYKIGETIAQAINSAFEFLNAFVHNFHWDSLGIAIREGILGVLNNIDWQLIYDTMSNLGAGVGTALQNAFNNPEIWTAIFTTISYGLNSIVYAIGGFLQSVDWASFGQNIGTGLNNGIEVFDWFSLGQDLVALIRAVFDFWYNFVTTFDFKKFGTHIGTTLAEAIRGINWTTGAASVAETINGLFDAFNGFMESMNWRELGQIVVNTIGAFFQNFSWSSFGEALHNVISSIYEFFTGVVETIQWAEIPGYIMQAIKDFFEGYDFKGLATTFGTYLGTAFKAIVAIGGELWNTIKEAFGSLIDGGFEGIKEKFLGIGSWIKVNIFDPFINAFKAAFGIASPSKVMAEMGKNLVEGLKQGLLNKINDVGNWLKTNVTGPILGFFEEHFQIGSPSKVMAEYGGYMMEGLEEGIESKTGLATNAMSGVQNDMQQVFGSFSQWANVGSSLLTVGLVVGISAKSQLVLFTVDKLNKSMLAVFTNSVNTWKASGTNLFTNLQNGMQSKQSSILSFVNNLMSTIRNNIANVAYAMTNAGQSLMSSLQSGMSYYSGSIASTASDIASNVYNAFMYRDWQSLGENIGMGIYNGLFDKQEWLRILAWNTAVAMYNEACEALDISSPSKAFAWIGEMMSEGMAKGVEDNEKAPIEAVVSLSEAVQAGAFENLQIPAVVKGEVVPYAATDSQNDISSNTLNSLSDMLQYIQDVVVTRDDVYEILTELLPRYLNIVLQMGDEVVARHANAGNAKLNRRFNTVNKVLV